MRSKVNSTMVRRTVAARGPRRAAVQSETGGAAPAWAVRLRRTRGRLLEIPSGRQGIHPPPLRARARSRALRRVQDSAARRGTSAALPTTMDATIRSFVESRYELYSRWEVT